MNGHMTLIPRYEDARQDKLTSDVYLYNKKVHWCGQNKLYDLFTSFVT